jgi:predicted esterase YcpF (UPF0227 family)
MDKAIIYLHGFLSSPQSQKAQQTLSYVQRHHPEIAFELPQIASYPLPAIEQLEALVNKHKGKHLGFIGSSLGGYLATYLSEKHNARAVLINPAVRPYELLTDYLGEHVNPYTQEAFFLQACHTEQLKNLRSETIGQAENYWVLLQTEDETLDYRLAAEKYAHSKLTIEQGGDHSFQGFERFIPDILRFLLSPS